MTDFIHEPPKEPSAAPLPEKKMTEQERQKRVYTYILVLFSAAFILILWSFLMTNRSNREVIDRLKDSASVVQTALDENNTLENRVKTLEAALQESESKSSEQEKSLKEQKKALEESERTLKAMELLLVLDQQYGRKDYDGAKATVDALEQEHYAELLPKEKPQEAETLSPFDMYASICSVLYPDGIPANP